eukprot:jgi/Chrpa1/27287/Chrysochromulina_OHIO_Genome00009311-RA
MLQPAGELHEVQARLLLRLRPVLADDLHEVTTGAELEHQVYMPLRGRHLVQLHDVRVLCRLQDPDLRVQILLQLGVEPRANDGLDGNDLTRVAVLPAVDGGKRALTNAVVQFIGTDALVRLPASETDGRLHL